MQTSITLYSLAYCVESRAQWGSKNDYGSGESWETRLDENLGQDNGWEQRGGDREDNILRMKPTVLTCEKLIN